MLDAIAQTLAEQATKPVAPANVTTPQAALVAPQQTAVPVLKPIVSAPEALSPSFSQPPQSAQPAQSISKANAVADLPANTSDRQAVAPSPKNDAAKNDAAKNDAAKNDAAKNDAAKNDAAKNDAAKNDAAKNDAAKNDAARNDQVAAATTADEQATINQRLVLKQRLADIVAKDKRLKEVKLLANLEAMAIAAAEAGQFVQARQMAHDTMLPPEKQVTLLAQIDALEANHRSAKAPPAQQTRLPKALKPLAATKSLAEKVKAWVPTTVPGRSLPSVLQFTPPPSSPSYSYVTPVEPQYVSYSLNGFGRSLGGIGVVVDDSTPDFNGQNWTGGYEAGGGFNPAELWQGLSFIFPLAVPAPITSPFGWRVHPIRGDRRLHTGTDLGAPMGTPVLAAADGKVALSDRLGGYGLAIILSHNEDTRETLYGHLSQIFVKPGQWVEKGTVIGRVGSTGLSTGPHLHFELRQKTSTGWQAIDPGVQLKSALARLVKAMQSG